VIPFPPKLIYVFLGIHPVPELGTQTFELEKTVGTLRHGDHSGGFTDDPLGKVEPLAQGKGTNLRLVEVVGRGPNWFWHGVFS
jgi:hypothetical protein